MTQVNYLGVAAVDVVFVRSPRYLAETLADAVDKRLIEVRDERRFWKNVTRAFDLRPSELPALQARVAGKYCRNLDFWTVLPELRRQFRLALIYSGPGTVLDLWRGEYRLDQAFDEIVEAASHGLSWRDPDLYRALAERHGNAPEQCAVIDSTALGVNAAAEAGLGSYRYGTMYGFRQWLRDRERASVSAPAAP
jgi:FMN phosphatase YigB (HAD superfamily)